MSDLPRVYVPDRAAWRAWLEKNHATSHGIWLIYYKRGSGKPRVAYADAVEEALCFGWIDSTVRAIDEKRYCQQFTPRTNASNWSDHNRRRLRKLIDAGLMTQAGLARVHPEVLSAPVPAKIAKRRPKRMPPFFAAALRLEPMARKNFQNLAPSYRQQYIGWLVQAKREETREKRLREALSRLVGNQKLGMK